MSRRDERWISRLATPPAPAVRLVAFPHAGGGASGFATWRRVLPPDVELLAVQLPGREARAADAPVADIAEIVAHVAPLLAAAPTAAPTVYLGHSMGALVAYECARAAPPAHLVVSGRDAPHLPDPRRRHHLADDALLADMVALGGMPAELLAEPDLVEHVLAVLRADLAVAEAHAHRPGAPLPCPITALRGRDDPETTGAGVAAWCEHTAAAFRALDFQGGHFFLHDRAGGALAAVAALLRAP